MTHTLSRHMQDVDVDVFVEDLELYSKAKKFVLIPGSYNVMVTLQEYDDSHALTRTLTVR